MKSQGRAMETVFRELLGDRAELLAVCEKICPSMNGPKMVRLAQALVSCDPSEAEWLAEARADMPSGRHEHWQQELERLSAAGVTVVTALDESYPTNLALVHDGPPVLFVRGSFSGADRRSVAIVGTRSATSDGIDLAFSLAAMLASKGVTVISGLAKGIDTAAHAGALSVDGRTMAVFGTSVEKTYPAQNRALAGRIAATGACVSQFLTGRDTGRWAFPARNITMSGLALGTIVVEASETSGAKIQAEAALAHGKQLFLVDELVTKQKWANDVATEPNVRVFSDPGEIIEAVDRLVAPVDHVCL